MMKNLKLIFLTTIFVVLSSTPSIARGLDTENTYQNSTSPNIVFADARVKALCVQHWDSNGDGELSQEEAATVTNLNYVFYNDSIITSFNEFRYFTGLNSIHQYAFRECTALKSIEIPSSVSIIDYGAFYGCCELTSICIPNTVTDVGTYAFRECSGLTSVTISESMHEIGYGVFCECSGLTSVTIPNSITLIDEFAFDDCSSLKSVSIPSSVDSIGRCAFYGCDELNEVYCYVIDPSTLSIGSSAFQRNPTNYSSRYLYVPFGSISAYLSSSDWRMYFGHIIEIGGSSSPIIDFADARVKDICVQNWDLNGDGELSENEAAIVTNLSYAFRNDSIITSFNELSYFTGLNSIGQYEFRDCKNLKNITIPSTVTSLGYGAFYSCSKLESIAIPNSIVEMGERAFYECTGLTRVNISDIETWHNINFGSLSSPLRYAHHLYLNGTEVTHLTIPNSVTTVSNAFAYCTGITSVSIPNTVTAIDNGAFASCTGLTEIEIPNSVTSIGSEAFFNVGLTSITIPESITSIGYGAFHYSANLINVYSLITDPSLISMGSDVFYQYPANYSNRTLHVPIGSIPSYRASSGWNPYFGNIVEIGGNTVYANSISLNKSSAVLSNGESLQLIATVLPDNATNKSVIWTSSNNSVATVNSNGLVTAKSVGTASIKAQTTDGSNLSASCSITVTNNTNISFADPNVKAICVQNWDTNGDGELSKAEAAAVQDIGFVFKGNTEIKSFDEFQYFTGHHYLTSDAFYGCNKLERIVIPNTIKNIYSDAFRYCSSLMSITLPESLLTIGSYAFWQCRELDNVTIPNSVTSIGKYAFYDCNALKSVSLGDGITSINPATFKGCDNLKTISIGNSVSSISSEAFSDCPSLVSVVIPNSVTSIGQYAFYECTGLKNIKIGCSVNYIGDYAFYKCNALDTVTSSAMSPPEINSETFSSYSAKLIVPRSSVNLYKNADYWKKFYNIVGFYDFEQDGIYYNIIDNTNKKVEVTCRDESYNSYSGCLIIPSTVQFSGKEFLVSRIGMNAFRDCVNLTSIAIPNSITTIASSAFYNCVELENISLPKSITSIGQSAFVNCAKLTGIEIPNTVTSIGDYAFQGCDAISLLNFNAVLCADFSSTASHRPFYNLNIKTINIGDSVQKIPAYFAYGLTKLENLTIGKAVTSIGVYGFQGCTALKTINFNAEFCGNFNSYDNSPFYNLKITTLNIGDGVQRIPSYFAYGLSSLANIEIPSTINYIGYNAFNGCSSLEKVYITDIASWCKIIFNSSTANPLNYAHHLYLNGVEVSDLVLPSIISDISSYAFYGCTSLTKITIPKSVTSIGSSAFSNCTSLTVMNFNAISCADFNSSYNPFSNTFISSIIIGDDVVRIPDYFTKELTTLRAVTIGNSVTSIGNSAFYGCTSLTDISMGNSITTIGASAFYNCTGLTNIVLGSSVTTIGSSAFNKCTGLTAITFNDKVTTIYNSAFYGCTGLKSIELPSSVRTISSKAFYNCSGLRSVYSFALNPPVMESSDCFNVYNVATLFVPYEVLDTYKNTYYWNNFYRAYGVDPDGNVPITSISLNETNISLNVNQTYRLIAAVEPDYATNKVITWSTNNSAVAIVSNDGLVTALAAGTAKILATTTDGSNLSASCDVTVNQQATSISLNETEATLYTGNTLQLTATVLPTSTFNPSVTWSSNNTSVATVSSTGLVTAKSTGNVIITATTSDGSNLSASCSITVKRLATSISLNKSSATLYLNQTVQLTATVSPSNATDKSVVWSSSDNSIATVTSTGLVTAIAPGNATIKATTADGSNLSATCVITVKAYVTSLTIEPSEITILEGDTIILTPTILPTYATNQNLTWSSSNTSVASVNNGEVIARSGGETTITARTADGSNLNANCKVTVVPNFVISAPDLSHLRGSLNNKFDLTIDLLNRYEITGIQFDLLLPTDVTIAKDNDGDFNIWVDETRKSRNHTATASLISGNTYRILVSSATANSLKGHSGTVLHIMIEIPISHVSGNKQVKYSNIILSEPDETRHILPTMYSTISYYYKEGDANADVNVDVADYVITGNYILQNGPENFWYDAANVDHNSTIDVNDLTGITNIALGRREGGILQMPAMQDPDDNQDIELTANPLIIQAGQTKTMHLSLAGLRSFAGFQTDVQLPKGIKLADASLADENSDFSIATAELPDGSIRLLASSFSLKDLAVNDASFLKLTLTADDSFSGNDFITLDGIKISERDMTLHTIDGFAIPVGNDMSSLEQVYSVVRIYTDGMNVIIDSPESGTAQIVTIAGITQDREVHPGHNVIPMDNSGIYIVTLNGTTAKLYLK